MSIQNDPAHEELLQTLNATYDLKPQTLMLYARLWQLETWLRHIVYVELFSKYGMEWHKKIQGGGVDHARKNDKRLTHMPSIEEMNISFVTLGALVKTITAEWKLFETYLPPQKIWEAKVEEVEQIRHRIAHFRNSHRDDLQRVIQLLRDIDQGIWKFCVSFNRYSMHDPLSNNPNDPVMSHFGFLIPYAPMIGHPRQVIGEFVRLLNRVELSIKAIRRPWADAAMGTGIAGLEGWIYDINLHSFNNSTFDYDEFLKGVKAVHESIIYFFPGSSYENVCVMIPAILGEDKCIELIQWFLEMTDQSIRLGGWGPSYATPEEKIGKQSDAVKQFADNAPEYVLEPTHLINFLQSDMLGSILGV